MRSPLLLLIIALAISAVVALIGQALHFGEFAWLLALLGAMLAISAFDRERFGWTEGPSSGPEDHRTPDRN